MLENKLQGFEITQGLTDPQIQQLIAYSKQDPDIVKFTRDAERFKHEESASEFIEKAEIYALTDNKKLSGIIWFSKKPLPQREYTKVFDKDSYDTTFAIRMYGEARGKGLALPFMQEVFSLFQSENESHGIWLETYTHNTKALSLYEKFGFELLDIAPSDTNSRSIMRYNPS